jgi:hypothetical protein
MNAFAARHCAQGAPLVRRRALQPPHAVITARTRFCRAWHTRMSSTTANKKLVKLCFESTRTNSSSCAASGARRPSHGGRRHIGHRPGSVRALAAGTWPAASSPPPYAFWRPTLRCLPPLSGWTGLDCAQGGKPSADHRQHVAGRTSSRVIAPTVALPHREYAPRWPRNTDVRSYPSSERETRERANFLIKSE